MASRIVRYVPAVGAALVGGAGLGFVARDLLNLGQPEVALAWLAGAAGLGVAEVGRRRGGSG